MSHWTGPAQCDISPVISCSVTAMRTHARLRYLFTSVHAHAQARGREKREGVTDFESHARCHPSGGTGLCHAHARATRVAEGRVPDFESRAAETCALVERVDAICARICAIIRPPA